MMSLALGRPDGPGGVCGPSREEGLEVSSRGASIQRQSVGRCPREGAGNPGSPVLEEPEDAEGWGLAHGEVSGAFR